jgi:hypothetical protein
MLMPPIAHMWKSESDEVFGGVRRVLRKLKNTHKKSAWIMNSFIPLQKTGHSYPRMYSREVNSAESPVFPSTTNMQAFKINQLWTMIAGIANNTREPRRIHHMSVSIQM